MTPEARTPSSSRRKPAPALTRTAQAPAHSPQMLQHYQAALQLLQQGKYEKALVALEKLLASASPEISERCRMYIAACHRQMDKSKLVFDSPEERYDYAVSLLNMDYYEDAREQFLEILAEHPQADYALYGVAVLDAITGQAEECLENLSRAIALNARNRLLARADADFQSMIDDPRFTELLYPEAS